MILMNMHDFRGVFLHESVFVIPFLPVVETMIFSFPWVIPQSQSIAVVAMVLKVS